MTNPLLQTWQTPFEMPPFQDIQAKHFPEAFSIALAKHQTEIQDIANRQDEPTFENTPRNCCHHQKEIYESES